MHNTLILLPKNESVSSTMEIVDWPMLEVRIGNADSRRGTCDLYLFPRPSTINEVVQHNDFLVSGKSSSWDSAWALLECQLLVIPVYGLGHIDLQTHCFSYTI